MPRKSTTVDKKPKKAKIAKKTKNGTPSEGRLKAQRPKTKKSKTVSKKTEAKSPYFSGENDLSEPPSFIKKRKSKSAKMDEKGETLDDGRGPPLQFEPMECIEDIGDRTFPRTPEPPTIDATQFKRLLALERVEQRTEAWYALRKTMITASDWAKALGKAKSGNKRDLILKKCDQGPKFTGNIFTEWGVKYEAVATRLYELRNKLVVYEFGVLRHPEYPFLGASPDGITTLGIMLEIKCPYSRKITGIVPSYYWIQIQGQLEVCNLEYCDFLECQIAEYPGGMDEYLEDTEENPPKREYGLDDKKLQKKFQKGDVFQRTKDGFEKGATVTYVDSEGSKHYFYSEIGVSKAEFKRWYKSHKKKVDSHWTETRVSFWRFLKISCVRVQRDRRWFEEALPVLQEVWKEVKHYREIGCESLVRKNRRDHGEMVSEPDMKDISAAIHNNNDFGDLASHFLSGHLGAEIVASASETISVTPIEVVDPLVTNESVALTEILQTVRLHTEREEGKRPPRPPTVPDQEQVVDVVDKHVPDMPPSHTMFDLSHKGAIADLEIASWLLPRYVPLDPVLVNARALEERGVKMAGLCKMIVRCKTALVRLSKLPLEALQLSTYPLQNMVQSIHVWMDGLPRLMKDYLETTETEFDPEQLEALQKAALIANKWNETVYPKWRRIWDPEPDSDSDSNPPNPPSPLPDQGSDSDAAGAAIVESCKSRPPTPFKELMKKPMSELAPTRYAEIMNNEKLSEEEREEELQRLESLRGTIAKLDQFKYRG